MRMRWKLLLLGNAVALWALMWWSMRYADLVHRAAFGVCTEALMAVESYQAVADGLRADTTGG